MAAADLQKKVLGLSEAKPAGMMEEASAAGPAPDMTVGAFALYPHQRCFGLPTERVSHHLS